MVTNIERIRKAIKLDACNALLLKLNQIGTVTEALDALDQPEKPGGTLSFLIDQEALKKLCGFGCWLRCGPIQVYGAPARTERTCNYNQLLRIEEELGGKAKYSKIFG